MLSPLKNRLPRRVRPKWLLLLFLSVFFLLAALNFGVAWHYSSVLNDLALEVRESEVQYNLGCVRCQ